MGLLSYSNQNFKKGDTVKIKYMGIVGIIVDIDSTLYSVSYLNENDKEIIEAFSISDLEKC